MRATSSGCSSGRFEERRSWAMDAKARPRATVATPRAPSMPRNLIDRNVATTRAFNGIPKRFMITDRCASGINFARRVPIDGK